MTSKDIVVGWGRVDGTPKVLLKAGDDDIVLDASRAFEVAQALMRSARDVVALSQAVDSLPSDRVPEA